MYNMTGLDALDIPFKAAPGENFAGQRSPFHIRMSHCFNALRIGWYSGKIGVDIERKDRQFKAQILSKDFSLNMKIVK